MGEKRYVTANQLRRLGACLGQLFRFRQIFGDSVEVTVDACKAVADEFDWYWAAYWLLSFAYTKEFQRRLDPIAEICSKERVLLYTHPNIPGLRDRLNETWHKYNLAAAETWAELYLQDPDALDKPD